MTRLAIVPFDVPETFAPVGNESRNFGRDLARRFEVELHRTNPVPIVELFNRDRWPGKRDEFFTGNYGAISYARAAGYDFVMVGYLEDLKNDTDLTLYTKIIDTQNQVTVWHSKVVVVSDSRDWGKALASMRLGKYNPSDFSFSERANELAACTVDAIASEDSEPVPE